MPTITRNGKCSMCVCSAASINWMPQQMGHRLSEIWPAAPVRPIRAQGQVDQDGELVDFTWQQLPYDEIRVRIPVAKHTKWSMPLGDCPRFPRRPRRPRRPCCPHCPLCPWSSPSVQTRHRLCHHSCACWYLGCRCSGSCVSSSIPSPRVGDSFRYCLVQVKAGQSCREAQLAQSVGPES